MSFPKPHFTPEINLGHLLTAGTMIITLTCAGVGGVWSMQSQMLQLRADFAVQLAQHEIRLHANEIALDRDRAELLGYRSEVRGYLDKIIDQLADLRAEGSRRRSSGG